MNDVNYWLKPIIAEGYVLTHARVAGDWGVDMPKLDASFFHFVAEGHAYIKSEGITPIEMSVGDIVLVTHGTAHQMTHGLHSRTVSMEEIMASMNGVFSDAPDATTVLCGLFGVDRLMVLPAINALPPFLCLKASGNTPIAETLQQLAAEVKNRGFASKVVVRHLLSTLFVYILREWAVAKPAETGSWFSALQNPNIARALAKIHDSPADNWTLERLAQVAGLSRSAFAKQFNETVGEPPFSYLTRWRMGIAAQLLDQTMASLPEIAAKVGYTSEYTFNRAFKKARGLSPTQARAQKKNDILIG
jgi:AraC-like DNA-binding protein